MPTLISCNLVVCLVLGIRTSDGNLSDTHYELSEYLVLLPVSLIPRTDFRISSQRRTQSQPFDGQVNVLLSKAKLND